MPNGSTERINGDEEGTVAYGRGQRSRRTRNRNRDFKSYDGTDEDSATPTSGEEWDGGDEDDDADDQIVDDMDEDDLEMSDNEVSAADEEQDENNDARHSSLVVSLRYQKRASPRPPGDGMVRSEPPASNGTARPSIALLDDLQAQQAQQHSQTPTPQPDLHLQEAKPVSQDSKDSVEGDGSPTQKIPRAPEPSTYPASLAPPADAALI